MSDTTDAVTSAILEERARALAQPLDEAGDRGDVIEVITFELAHERYAVESRYVREVVRLADLTPVPGTPACFAGVVNLRGEIVAVVDLRAFLGVAASGLTDLARLVVLGRDGAELGVLADAVFEFTTVPVADLAGPSGLATSLARDCVLGVTPGVLIVLDAAALLRDPRFYCDGGLVTEDDGEPRERVT